MAILVRDGHDLSGTTANKPTNVETGQMYFDTDLNRLEVYNGSAWQEVAMTGGTVGAAAGTNVTAVEYGNNAVHKTVLTLAATPITLTDEAGVVLYGGQKVYDFPEGLLVFLGAALDADVAVAGSLNADADGDVGLGTVTASNNATLATTEQNLIPTTAIAQLVSSAGPCDCQSTSTESGTILDGTTTAVDAFLNFLWDDADHDGGTMTVTGTLTLIWAIAGDN